MEEGKEISSEGVHAVCHKPCVKRQAFSSSNDN